MEIKIIYFSFIYSTYTIWQPTKNYLGDILRVNKWFGHSPYPQGIFCLWKEIHNIFIKQGLYQVMLSYAVVKRHLQNLHGFTRHFLISFMHCLPWVWVPPGGRYLLYAGSLFKLLQSCDNSTSTGDFRIIITETAIDQSIRTKYSARKWRLSLALVFHCPSKPYGNAYFPGREILLPHVLVSRVELYISEKCWHLQCAIW